MGLVVSRLWIRDHRRNLGRREYDASRLISLFYSLKFIWLKVPSMYIVVKI